MNEFDRFVKNNIGIINYALSGQEPRAKYGAGNESQLDLIPIGFYSNGSRIKVPGIGKLQIEEALKRAKDRVTSFVKKNKFQKVEHDSNLCPINIWSRLIHKSLDWKQKQIEYGKKVLGENTKAVVAPRYRKKVQLMDYEEAKNIFWKKYLSQSFVAKRERFIVLPHIAPIIEQLVKYFICDPSCKLNLSKGIFLCGPVGTSKTSIMTALSNFCKDQGFENAFSLKKMHKLNKEIGKSGFSALDELETGDYCFDDIGLRQRDIISYGTSIMPSDEVIKMRYDRFTKLVPRVTHYTSNINFKPCSKDGSINEEELEELIKTYDERSIDRIIESCNFIYLECKSWRRV